MRHDPDAPGLLISPHLDDAVLSAWTVLTGPGEVSVVNVCTAVPPAGSLGSFDPVFGAVDSAALMALRVAEDAEALAAAGRSALALGFLDLQYRGAEPAAGIAGAVAEALRGPVQRAAWLCAPAGIGGHPDHVAVRDAALAVALAADADSAAAVAMPVSLYADLPYAVAMGWPSWVTGSDPRPFLVPEARWHADLEAARVAPGRLAPRPVRLGAGAAAAKLRALRSYRTQFEALNGGPVRRLEQPEILGFELFWDVER